MGKLSEALEKATPKADIDGFQEDKYPAKHDIPLQRDSAPDLTAVEASGNIFTDVPSGEENWSERLRLALDPLSSVSESFKRLRAKIVHPSKGKPAKTILVTSVSPGEGKGFACANLGVSLAKGLEYHSLMVDCDLRRPTLAELFGLPNTNGLVDHLAKNIDLSLVFRKTGLPKLSLIPAGVPPVNPAELLDSKRMVRLINELKSRYEDRYILFDSAPSMVGSETTILAKHVDGVVLVVRWGVSRREQVKKLVEAIGKEKIVGLVFNAFEESELDSMLKRKGTYKDYRYYKY